MIDFHPITVADRDMVRSRVWNTDCRNCDLNFTNLVGWQFVYETEVALWQDFLLFRFKSDGRNAYLAPVGNEDWRDVITEMMADAERNGTPFLMLGVCENALARLNAAMPGVFHAEADRRFSDYIYRRDALSTLSGKKLQPKRNHINKFQSLYPDHEYRPLTPQDIPECLALEEKWRKAKDNAPANPAERRFIEDSFERWAHLDSLGGTLRVGGTLVAFTFGAPINHDTFGVCIEKADTDYEGAYPLINREFVRHIPEQYTLINREEDLGIEGLRHAKLSYQPEILLHKHIVTTV